MDNKELYSYIIGSLDIMNKSIILNEQNCVKLFSYLYNNYYDLNNKVNDLEQTISNINNNIIKINDDITKKNNLISKEVNQLKKVQKQYNDKLLIIEKKKTRLQIFLENTKGNICKFFNNVYNKSKDMYHKIYDYIYKIIYYKKIQKEEEEKRIKEEQEKLKKEKEYKETIKNILKK